jgi:hypothetical protein
LRTLTFWTLARSGARFPAPPRRFLAQKMRIA